MFYLISVTWRGLTSPQTIRRRARSSSGLVHCHHSVLCGTTCKKTWAASDHLKRALRQGVLNMTHVHVSFIPLSLTLCPVTFRPSDQHWSFSGIFAQSTSLFRFHTPPWSLDLMPGPTEAAQAQRQLQARDCAWTRAHWAQHLRCHTGPPPSSQRPRTEAQPPGQEQAATPRPRLPGPLPGSAIARRRHASTS